MKKTACFVAGTLVHTDQGLVPIEQLKVGDMVLSRSEHDPDAPNEYKRVFRTIKSAAKQKLSYVKYMVNVDGLNEQDGNRYVFCKDNHPFYINRLAYDSDSNSSTIAKRLGWTAAGLLGTIDYDEAIETLHRDKALAVVDPIADNNVIRVLWTAGSGCAVATIDEYGYGPLFDFRQGRPIAIGGGGIKMGSLSEMDWVSPEQEQIIYPSSDDDPNVQLYLSAAAGDYENYENYVYNIEVEDYHTYFVEKIGLWVHDTSSNKELVAHL
jgi:transcription-repair coupling factor (superfamily II helicase)